MIDVSVIIPAYNAELFLKDCLESLLQQGFAGMEILVIDDGSTDSTPMICSSYQQKDSRIIYYRQENSGVSVARNVGIAKSKGKWLSFVDADDVVEHSAIQDLINLVETTDADVALGCSYSFSARTERRPYKVFKDLSNESFSPIRHSALWGYIFKASIIKNNNINFVPGLAFSEDRVFLYEYSIFVRKFVTTSKYVYAYRDNDVSVCKVSSPSKKFVQHINAAAALKSILGRENLDSKIKHDIKNEIKRTIDLGFHMFAYSDGLSLSVLKKAEYNFMLADGHFFVFLIKFFYWRFRYLAKKMMRKL